MASSPKVLIVVDKEDWAFDRIAKAVRQYCDRDFSITIGYLRGREKALEKEMADYDLIFFMHWSLSALIFKPLWARVLKKDVSFEKMKIRPRFPGLDLSKVVTGIHGHHDHDDRKSMPDHEVVPAKHLIDFLARFKGVNAVSHRLVRCFSAGGLQGVVCTENGVDKNDFKPLWEPGGAEKLRVGCSGTKKRDWKEGISEFIEPLANLPFVELRIATPEDGRYVPADKMPEFLNGLDVYVQASSSEGFPLKVLEACASGRAVISTRVGGCEDLIVDGENGFLVDRTNEAIEDKVKYFNDNPAEVIRMGARNRELVEENWSWEVRAKDWLDFIEKNL